MFWTLAITSRKIASYGNGDDMCSISESCWVVINNCPMKKHSGKRQRDWCCLL